MHIFHLPDSSVPHILRSAWDSLGDLQPQAVCMLRDPIHMLHARQREVQAHRRGAWKKSKGCTQGCCLARTRCAPAQGAPALTIRLAVRVSFERLLPGSWLIFLRVPLGLLWLRGGKQTLPITQQFPPSPPVFSGPSPIARRDGAQVSRGPFPSNLPASPVLQPLTPTLALSPSPGAPSGWAPSPSAGSFDSGLEGRRAVCSNPEGAGTRG